MALTASLTMTKCTKKWPFLCNLPQISATHFGFEPILSLVCSKYLPSHPSFGFKGQTLKLNPSNGHVHFEPRMIKYKITRAISTFGKRGNSHFISVRIQCNFQNIVKNVSNTKLLPTLVYLLSIKL